MTSADRVSIRRKAYLADSDATGFVYYARYLEWMEAGRIDLLAVAGSSLGELRATGLTAVVRSVSCSFASPIALGHEVRIDTFIKRFGNTSIEIGYTFENTTLGKSAGEGDVTVVFLDATTLRPARVPEDLRVRLASYIQSSEH